MKGRTQILPILERILSKIIWIQLDTMKTEKRKSSDPLGVPFLILSHITPNLIKCESQVVALLKWMSTGSSKPLKSASRKWMQIIIRAFRQMMIKIKKHLHLSTKVIQKRSSWKYRARSMSSRNWISSSQARWRRQMSYRITVICLRHLQATCNKRQTKCSMMAMEQDQHHQSLIIWRAQIRKTHSLEQHQSQQYQHPRTTPSWLQRATPPTSRQRTSSSRTSTSPKMRQT